VEELDVDAEGDDDADAGARSEFDDDGVSSGNDCSTGEGGFEARGLGNGPALRRLRRLALSSKSSKVGFLVVVSCWTAAALAAAEVGEVASGSVASSIVEGIAERPSKELLGCPRSRAACSSTIEAGGGAWAVVVGLVDGCEQD
jgi:hypothetical protein